MKKAGEANSFALRKMSREPVIPRKNGPKAHDRDTPVRVVQVNASEETLSDHDNIIMNQSTSYLREVEKKKAIAHAENMKYKTSKMKTQSFFEKSGFRFM